VKCFAALIKFWGVRLDETHRNHVAALISLYFLTLGILYSASTPPFEGPDELAHFIYIHNIVKDRQLPVIPDKDTAFDTRNYEVHQLPLYT
jgi:hypothetical protein